jgi:hypothetical protein
MSQRRTYLVIEPGAESSEFVCPPGATRTFGEGTSGLRDLVAEVESAAEADRARGDAPRGLILVAGPDTGATAIELRARLLGSLAEAMLPWGGELRISAAPGRPRLAAQALLEWVGQELQGSPVRVALQLDLPYPDADAPFSYPRAA